MEDSPQDNLTTRSLLKGILATETIHPPVFHQTENSFSRIPVRIIHQEKIPVTPSISLQSQMKERVRRSLGKLALENSSMKSINAKMKRKVEKKSFYNVVEELDKTTPRTLLKKIIQNEDEASIIVSQGSKAAFENDTKQEGTCNSRLSRLRNVNLSLSDLQDTDHLKVFRNTWKKRRIDISEFEREVDEKILVSEDNLDENFEDSSVENVNLISRFSQQHPSVSSEPRSAYKTALLRKPNKAFLVSLGDFEQGVEDKYHLVKGSQECFIESVIEERSPASASKVAELNTELYVQPLLSNAHNSEKSLKSRSKHFPLRYKKKNEDTARLRFKTMGQSIDTSETVVEDVVFSETTRSSQKRTLIEEDTEKSKLNRSMQNSKSGKKALKIVEADNDLCKSVILNSALIGLNQTILKYEQNQLIHISMSKEDQKESFITLAKDGSFHTSQTLENSLSLKKDARKAMASGSISKSKLADEDSSRVKLDVCKGDAFFEVESHVQDVPSRSSEAKDKNGINRISHTVEDSEINEENEKQYSTINIHVLSSMQEDFKSLQGDRFESTMDSDTLSHQEKLNKQPMLLTLIDTPSYIRRAQFTYFTDLKKQKSKIQVTDVNTDSSNSVNKNKSGSTGAPFNKFYFGKKVHKEKTLKKKKEGMTLKRSFVKQIFGLHSKMRVSKETYTDVETCLEEYLNQLTGDLAAYTAHADRKTVLGGDLELLMKRQRLVMDPPSLNVLIEQHLPLECRKLLIPCAISGNKVFPCLAKK